MTASEWWFAAMVWAFGYSWETGTTGRTGIRSFDKRRMLCGPSFLLDGEAVNCNESGLPDFDTLRHRRNDRTVFLYAFDLIDLDGRDLRREPIESRKIALAKLLRKADYGIFLSEHVEDEAAIVFQHSDTSRLGAWQSGLDHVGAPVAKLRGSRHCEPLTGDILAYYWGWLGLLLWLRLALIRQHQALIG
jgi:hypothetical protein